MSYFEMQPDDMRHGYYEDEENTARVIRHQQQIPENYDYQYIYATQPGKIIHKYGAKQRQMAEQYDDINEGNYYTTDLRNERHGPMHNNFVTTSPNMHFGGMRRPSNQKHYSPNVMAGNLPYLNAKERPEYFEQNKRSKYNKQEFRDDNSELDIKEAQMFSSMSQAELRDHVIQNTNYDDYEQKEQSEVIIDQLHK